MSLFLQSYQKWEASVQKGENFAYRHFYDWQKEGYRISQEKVRKAIELWQIKTKEKKKKSCKKKRKYPRQTEICEEKEKKDKSQIFYAVGQLFCMVEDYQTAIIYWKDAVALGHSEALYRIGNWYLGIGPPIIGDDRIPNLSLATQCYKKLMEQKHMDALAVLARGHFYGVGTYKDEEKAIKICHEAMQNDNTLAFIFRGDFFHSSNNYIKAAECYRHVIKQKLTPETMSLIEDRLIKYYLLGLGGIPKDLNEVRFYQSGTFFYYYERKPNNN